MEAVTVKYESKYKTTAKATTTKTENRLMCLFDAVKQLLYLQ